MLRIAILIAALLGTATVLAACGGSSPTKTTASSAHSSQYDAALRVAQCMRTHGVPDFPDPMSNGGSRINQNSGPGGSSISVDGVQLNVSAPAFQRAMLSCQKYAPKGPAISGAQLAAIQKGAIKMAQCMRANGVPNFPDPQVSTGPGGHGVAIRIGVKPSGGAGINPSSPAFRRAQAKCQPIMAAFMPDGKRS